MWNKLLAASVVALLLAGALFLPERLLEWGDRQLLDRVSVESQREDREGFAERIQLAVPEKVMLLRSGKLTVMELDPPEETGETLLTSDPPAGLPDSASEEPDRYAEETRQLWDARLTAARRDIRSLQTLGGLPEIWHTEGPLEYTEPSDLLYLDTDTHMSFPVYRFTLRWEAYSLEVLVDQQSERILSFTLQWVRGGQPNWGPRGASNFGSAWRDYWEMDSVSTGWYNAHLRNALENAEEIMNGDYAARDQITFMYDGQSLSVPLDCQGAWNRDFSVVWNR